MTFTHRQKWMAAIALLSLILLTLLVAPLGSDRRQGSSYARSPDGYGAWYADLEKQGVCIARWRSPLADLKGRGTFLRVNHALQPLVLTASEQQWVQNGNTLIILGVEAPVSAAEFRTLQSSAVGPVKVETTRRLPKLSQGEQVLLGDPFGAIVWQKTDSAGKLILATTPHLAANAYQDETGNYPFLAKLATANGGPIWVDEYSHGYRQATNPATTDGSSGKPAASLRETPPTPANLACDQQVATAQQTALKSQPRQQTWLNYLAKTPLVLVFSQTLVLLALAIWAQNHRFGLPQPLTNPSVDNSTAYIQALATVLQKADCSDFVLDVVGKAEQVHLQRRLGLGNDLVDPQVLLAAWQHQTGLAPTFLEQLLIDRPKHRCSDQDLLIWLGKWQAIREQLQGTPSPSSLASQVEHPAVKLL